MFVFCTIFQSIIRGWEEGFFTTPEAGEQIVYLAKWFQSEFPGSEDPLIIGYEAMLSFYPSSHKGLSMLMYELNRM